MRTIKSLIAVISFMLLLSAAVPASAQSSQDIALKAGFNFVAFTIAPTLAPAALKAQYPAIEDIYGFSAAAGSFVSVSEGTLTSFSSGRGYIVKASADANISVAGTALTIGAVNLKSGFNLVGFPKVPIPVKFSELMMRFSNIRGMYKWLPASGSFVQVIRKGALADILDGIDPSLSTGQAYFVNVDSDISINVDFGSIASKINLPTLYSNFFKPSTWNTLFDAAADGISINGIKFGKYLGGIRGLIFFLGMRDSASKYLNLLESGDTFDITAIEKLAGKQVFIKRAANTSEISFYNPEIIIWGRDNLIPEPTETVFSQNFSSVYATVFSRFFRVMVETYLDLKKSGIDAEKASYQAEMAKPGFNGVTYLENRFKGRLSEYSVSYNGMNLTPALAYGFWIRRTIDGTAPEAFTGLEKVMLKYDSTWYSTVKAKY